MSMKRGRDDDEEASTPIFASDHAEVVSRLAADAKKKQETLEALKTTIEERGKPSTPLVAAPAASFHRIVVTGVDELDAEGRQAAALLRRALEFRAKYFYQKPQPYWGSFTPEDVAPKPSLLEPVTPPVIARSPSSVLGGEARPSPIYRPPSCIAGCQSLSPPPADVSIVLRDGVYHITKAGVDCTTYPGVREFLTDYDATVKIVHTPSVRSFCTRRLSVLESRFELHRRLNDEKEQAELKAVPHRDFYNVRKVDTHVHHSACMNQKHLLKFIRKKLKTCPDDVVLSRDGEPLTLAQVFEMLGLTAYDLSIDTLDMHAHADTFQRFDRFNLKYNPAGQSRLREIFLKTDNFIRGRYLAEITREVFADLETSKYSLAEYRLSVYGRSRLEWGKLAAWVVDNGLFSPNVRWMIQVPRLYSIYKSSGELSSFQDMIDNIFGPLFEVSVNPASDPKLHMFLSQVSGFDCVDDESVRETFKDPAIVLPSDWTFAESPPYHFWVYYLAANLATLNQYRATRQYSQFSFRPHAGEAGDFNHLVATFLTAESVNHGITMRQFHSCQYLYYLAQVGIAMSPLSNNKLFIEYTRNPFYDYFIRGLNVSLSTDDPLILHFTKEPLVEEYCVAAQLWKFSGADLCEIARNSVLQSGFEHPFKAHFLGESYTRPGPAGNTLLYTNVPNIRLLFRHESLEAERALLRNAGADKM